MSVALSIAGSDSGGGAGLQADLKTFAAVGVHGTSVTTCLTAQNPREVLGVHPSPTPFIKQQLKALFDLLPPQAAKTGMLYSAGIIREVASWWKRHPDIPLVVDPVMIATSGAKLLQPSAITALRDQLLPLATLITPNLDEAAFLLNRKIAHLEELREAARVAYQAWGCAVLMKGGHLKRTSKAVDVFFDGRNEQILSSPFVRNVHTHGTGCTYSAAIAGFLAKGDDLATAVKKGKELITAAIQGSRKIGKYHVLDPFAYRSKRSRS